MGQRKYRILVFPCGTEIGLEIHNSLKWSTHVELYGASSVSSNHGSYVYRNYIEGIPFVQDDSFIPAINKLIETYGIDFIYPAHDSAVLKLAQCRADFKCKVIASEYRTCSVCRSKSETYNALISRVAVPIHYRELGKIQSFPVFLKPDVGEGSRGVFIAFTKEEVEFYCARNPSLLILEYLPGKEYTVDCFTDRHGVLRFIGPRERLRISNGISVSTIPVKEPRFEQMAQGINKLLKLSGAWFFQVKERANGEPVLLEVGPRIAGTMGLYRNLGINFCLLSIFDAMDIDIQIDKNNFFLQMDRALISRFNTDLVYEHVYIDLDDTLVMNDRVNPVIVSFLFQCINDNIKLHLLSKHAGDIDEALKRFRLYSLFDTVINIPADEKKADYIKEKSAILIDDSFSERRQVKIELGIPTFDTHSLESLLSWKY